MPKQRRIELHVKLKGIAHSFHVPMDYERTFLVSWWGRTFVFHHQDEEGSLIYMEETCYHLIDRCPDHLRKKGSHA